MARIVVIGDLLLDKYDYCENRNNPESSGPCYTVIKTEYKLGGAGNVAANLTSLGSDVELISVLGGDKSAEIIEGILKKSNIEAHIIKDEKRDTIVKERTLSITDKRYHFRKDFEKKQYIDDNHVNEIIEKIKECEYIIISDYNKGTISENLMRKIMELKKKVIIDPKPNHYKFYKGAYIITPNVGEANRMTNLDDDIESVKEISQELSCNVLLTRSEKGIYFYGEETFELPADAKEVFDVTGAGDTVIATLVHFLAKGKSIRESVMLANKAAGISIMHSGCYQVTEKDIFEYIEKC